jgi:hypothetical protein
MQVSRTILAVLVALSLAMLPLAGATAAPLKSTDHMASEVAHDCCHHGSPCDDHANSAGDHAARGICAKCCSSLAAVFFADVAAPLKAAVPAIHAGTPLPSHIASPPFRPPRV